MDSYNTIFRDKLVQVMLNQGLSFLFKYIFNPQPIFVQVCLTLELFNLNCFNTLSEMHAC